MSVDRKVILDAKGREIGRVTERGGCAGTPMTSTATAWASMRRGNGLRRWCAVNAPRSARQRGRLAPVAEKPGTLRARLLTTPHPVKSQQAAARA